MPTLSFNDLRHNKTPILFAGRVGQYMIAVEMLLFLIGYCFYVWMRVRNSLALKKKFRISLIVAFAGPFLIGPIFKYFLLVPMPFEGMVVALMDYIWYG